MINLYLVRHGETIENAAHILQGHIEGQLSKKGIEQAQEIAEHLSKEHFDIIVSSDLQRALHTAEIINRFHHLFITKTSLLRERDWGELSGMNIYDIHIHPEEFPDSVENPKQLQLRARKYLKFLLENFEGNNVLSIGHGYFNRCILAEINHVTPHDIPRIKNAEVRKVTITKEILLIPTTNEQEDEISVN